MKRWWLVFALMLLAGSAVYAQDAEPAPSGIEIAWPKPVTEVWGTVPVVGTVSIPDLAIYFVEAIALNDDLSIPENAPWIPVSPASSVSVVNGLLAEVDTSDAPDGLYALRVSVTTANGDVYTAVVSPLRVSNARYAAERARIEELLGIATPEPTEEAPEETPADTSPRVTPSAGNQSVNVRRCDLIDNARCPVLGFLVSPEEASVTARSANGSGWLQVRLAAGLVGWVSPTVVELMGDPSALPLVSPPPPLAPVPTPIPAAQTILNGLSIDGGALTCNVPGVVRVNVHNPGTTNSNPGLVTVQDVALRTGSVTATSTGSFPAIAPGGNFVVVVALTVSTYFNELHQIRAISNGQQLTITYTLAVGNCAGTPPPAPPAPPSSWAFQQGECALVIRPGATTFIAPFGPQAGTIGAEGATRDASAAARVQGELWFETFADFGPAFWVRGSDAAFDQVACRTSER